MAASDSFGSTKSLQGKVFRDGPLGKALRDLRKDVDLALSLVETRTSTVETAVPTLTTRLNTAEEDITTLQSSSGSGGLEARVEVVIHPTLYTFTYDGSDFDFNINVVIPGRPPVIHLNRVTLREAQGYPQYTGYAGYYLTIAERLAEFTNVKYLPRTDDVDSSTGLLSDQSVVLVNRDPSTRETVVPIRLRAYTDPLTPVESTTFEIEVEVTVLPGVGS